MRKTTIVITCVLAILLLFIAFLYVIFSRNSQKIVQANFLDGVRTVIVIPPDYLKLFRNPKQLTFDRTIESKDRNPISQFDYEKDFRISVYRLDSPDGLTLGKESRVTAKSSSQTEFFLFNVLDKFSKYDLVYRTGPQDKISSIYLNIDGDQTSELVKNDSLLYYYSQARSFYIKYKQDGVQDFFMGIKYENQREGVKIPIEVMFKKQGNNVYLIIMTSADSLNQLKPGALADLIVN